MKYLSTGITVTALFLTACSPPGEEPVSESTRSTTSPTEAVVAADTVYTNGKIYTVDNDNPWAEAVAIRDGKFLVVGSADDTAGVTGPNTETVDLGGQFAMPGTGDPHIHAGLLMPKRAFCALPGTFYEPSEEMIMTELKKCIAEYPEDREWFIAQGFSTPAMSPETLTREVLDSLIPNRPAWIEDESGHNAWFNTLAMQAAGVGRNFEDTPEEFFSRTEDGDLAGVAFEGAMNPFLEVLPPFDVEIQKVGFNKLLDEALSKGITMVGDGYTFDYDLEAWQELKREGLRQHVVLYLKGNLGTAELTPVETLEEWWSGFDLPGHKAVKLGMGGALESYSEALIDGYADPERSARPIIAAGDFADYMRQLDDAGFQVMVHAIGDGTVRATLDGFESVIRENGNNRLRHHIDHCSLIHRDDFQRFVDLDVSCTIWPPLNAPVAYNIDGIKPVLKPKTWARMYDNRARWDVGMRLVNHSDAPAAVLWPWWGMEASATRGFPGKPEIPKMGPEHALTVAELIEAYTINVAWSLRLDDVAGSIEEGKWADMIVLNHNLLEIPETDIHKTKVNRTVFKGRVVYESE